MTLARSRWAALGAAIAVSAGAGGVGLVQAGSSVESAVTPIAPCRLVDTRSPGTIGARSTPLGAGQTMTVSAVGTSGDCDSIPVVATALNVNLTSVGATAASFVTAFPADASSRPGVSHLNPTPGLFVSTNGIMVSLSDDGSFKIYNEAGRTDILVDVLGFYTPGTPGEKGEKGDQGNTGAAGPKGDDGENGAAGPPGETGPQGPQGVAGVDGEDGAAGAPGADGEDGEDGADGAPGEKGDQGDAGPEGPQGPIGPAGGPAGPQGPAGPTGPAGPPGPAGPAGADGEDGAPGAPGVDGEDGAPGAPGVDGEDGAPGLPGVDGEDGLPGADGAEGAPGLPGADGAPGPAGPAGPAGPTGPPGEDGQDGAPGAPGADGADGAPGLENLSRQAGVVVTSSVGQPTTAALNCPPGQYVISGGHSITAVSGVVPEILSNAPLDADTWQVVANSTTGSYDLQAIALCADLPGQV